MGVGTSVGDGVGVRTSVGSIAGVFIAVGISVVEGVLVRITMDADVDSDIGELDICLELQALIPKSKIMKNIPILFISLLELQMAAQRLHNLPAFWLQMLLNQSQSLHLARRFALRSRSRFMLGGAALISHNAVASILAKIAKPLLLAA